jgi:hypothetical protein
MRERAVIVEDIAVGSVQELERLEKAYASRTEFMDRATHLLLVARSRQVATPAAPAARVVAST